MALPERIGRYRILGLLGKGAMGIVYRGRDESLERDVAVKVLLGQTEDERARARFQREARAAARLQHPNIVTVYELGEHDGAPYMAMELLEGADLQRAIERGLRPDPRVTLPIVLQVLAGLGHAHEHGIVHRDMKPSNVFLPHKGLPKIMDFGLARVSGGASTGKDVAGTPNYMSPEQVRGETLDGRSDLFSTGLILYELVTGEKAYRGDSIVALLFKIAHEAPDLSLIPPGRDWQRLRQVLARAVAREPGDRYPDARSMSADLAGALEDLGGKPEWSGIETPLLVRGERATPAEAPPASTSAGASSAVPVAAGEPVAQAVAAGSSRGRVLAMMAGLGFATAGLVSLVFVVTRSASRPGPAPATPTSTLAPVSSAVVRSSTLAEAPTPAPPGPAATATPERPTPDAAGQARGTTPHEAPPATPTPAVAPETTATVPPTVVPALVPAEPAPASASVERSRQLLERGRLNAALAEARAVLQRDPGNAAARKIAQDAEVALLLESCIQKAEAALERGDNDAAMEEIQACRAVAPNDPRLLLLWRRATQ